MDKSNRDSIMQYVESLDKDHNGSIDLNELKKFFADEGADQATGEAVQVLFDVLDTDGNKDGKVSTQELLDFLASVEE